MTVHSVSASFLVGLAPFLPARLPIFLSSVSRCIARLFPCAVREKSNRKVSMK